jgi:transposase
MPQTVIGCDLARGWIDTHILPSGATARIENTSDAVIRWTASLPKDALVVLEGEAGTDRSGGPIRRRTAGATGLSSPRFPSTASASRVNPRQAREFARALGVLARTDRVDAWILAEMGRMLPLEATAPPDPDRARLADFLRRRKQLVEMRHRPRRCAGTMRDSPRSCTRSRP